MLGRRNNTASLRPRLRNNENQENAHVAIGKPAVGKPVLGKSVLGGNAGVQTRSRAALGDRSNTYRADLAASNQETGKNQIAKKDEVSKGMMNLVAKARKIGKTAANATTRPKQPSKSEAPPAEVVDENAPPAADDEEMEVDETSRSLLMEIEVMSDATSPSKKSQADQDQEDLATCERRYPGRSDARDRVRNDAIEFFEGGITEAGMTCKDRITNPDLVDLPNAQMVSNYVYDIFDYLQDLELERMPLTVGFLEHCSEISSRMRYVLVDWMVQIHSRFEMLPETLYLSIGLMDRYLSTSSGSGITKDNLQLLGVTAMMVAAKFEEMYPPDVTDFTYVTGNAYNCQQLREFEWELLSRTGFYCTMPTPITFLRRLSRLMQATGEMHSAAKYFLELTTTEYCLCYVPGCLRAAACLCLAVTLLKNANDDMALMRGETVDEKLFGLISDKWVPNLQFSAGYLSEEIFPVARKIAVVVERQVAPSKYRAIHNKYAAPEIHSIALRSELRCPLLSHFAAGASSV